MSSRFFFILASIGETSATSTVTRMTSNSIEPSASEPSAPTPPAKSRVGRSIPESFESSFSPRLSTGSPSEPSESPEESSSANVGAVPPSSRSASVMSSTGAFIIQPPASIAATASAATRRTVRTPSITLRRPPSPMTAVVNRFDNTEWC